MDVHPSNPFARLPRGRPILGSPLLAIVPVLALAGTAAAQYELVPREPAPEQSIRWGPLNFRYELTPAPADRIRLTARVTNTADHPVALDLPWCLAWLRLRQDGRSVWDRGAAESCGGMTRRITLAPGETEEDRYSLRLAEWPLPLVEGSILQVSAFLPGHRLPWLPPRAAAEVPLTRVTVRRADAGETRFARELGVPGLTWRSPAEAVVARLTREGFRPAGSHANGSLLFNGHGFLGRNAGLIARMHGNRLLKLVALMEPDRPRRIREEFRDVRERLERFYGPPRSLREGPNPLALWRKPGPAGMYSAALRLTDDGVIRLDLETPEWVGLHGADAPDMAGGGRPMRM